jgi:hypothetical protein
MEDGNLLDFGQTGVIAVNHILYYSDLNLYKQNDLSNDDINM